MRFPADCPKAPCNFPPRKDGILQPPSGCLATLLPLLQTLDSGGGGHPPSPMYARGLITITSYKRSKRIRGTRNKYNLPFFLAAIYYKYASGLLDKISKVICKLICWHHLPPVDSIKAKYRHVNVTTTKFPELHETETVFLLFQAVVL